MDRATNSSVLRPPKPPTRQIRSGDGTGNGAPIDQRASAHRRIINSLPDGTYEQWLHPASVQIEIPERLPGRLVLGFLEGFLEFAVEQF